MGIQFLLTVILLVHEVVFGYPTTSDQTQQLQQHQLLNSLQGVQIPRVAMENLSLMVSILLPRLCKFSPVQTNV